MLEDRYEVLSSIGTGSAANVFRVRDLRSGAVRAAKVLKTEHAASADTLARFEDEFRILRALHHPHLPEVYDYGWSADGGRFLVMELVDGEPLDRYFRAHPEDIWVILYELCETLVFVHGRNLLHQDIKPSNILVTRSAGAGGNRPAIKLIDFGLTYRRGSGASVKLVGTAEYIAPEVVRGEKTLTRAVDYYSLGATLFELLTGAPPFTGSENDVLRAHLEREPVIEQEELEWAELYPHVRALLSKDPQARLAAFEEFRRAVVGRSTGGIEDLDQSYALARIDSLGMIGKESAFDQLMGWLQTIGGSGAAAHTVSVTGGEGVGKRYLLGALRSEASTRGVRTLAPADIDTVRADETVARQPALMWSRLLEMCEKEPVILIVARPSTLPDEERSFVRLAGTQWELMRSRGRVLPLYFLVAVDSTTDDGDVLDYLPSETPLKIDLAAMSKAERDQIVSQFRGSMFDSRDARALTTYLGRFEEVGGALQGLQQAVLRSGLTFVGQRWKVQPSLLSEIVTSRTNESFSRDLVSSLSPLERTIAALVAAHPEPVPLAWVADFARVEPAEVLSIIRGSLKRLCAASSETLAPTSGAIRLSLRAGSDADSMQRAHAFLIERLVGLERTVTHDRALAYHHEQLGAVRDAARIHLRLLQAYWGTRPRERPYELIEGLCRSGLELLANHRTTVSKGTRRHLFCFYLKQWINAFWARNLFTHAKPIIDEWTSRLNETMPASVAPRYVRSVLELEGPEKALAKIGQMANSLHSSSQLRTLIQLEGSLCLHQAGQYEPALAALNALADISTLSTKDRYRLEIYRCMHLMELREDQRARESMAGLLDRAYGDGCLDEALLMRALVARSLLGEGQTKASLKSASVGLRIALAAGLHYRANLMYRLASSAYTELGDVPRAKKCQEKAIQLADALGIRDMAGISWSRLATAERAAGRYGNALRYYERAIAIMGQHGSAWSRNQAHVSLYGLHVLMQSDEKDAKEADIASRVGETNEHNELGFYHCWRGWDLEFHGKSSGALDEYRRAQHDFRQAGHRSNVTWAMSRELRVLLNDKPFEMGELMVNLESEVAVAGSNEAAFEMSIIRLKESFLSRSSRAIVLKHAQACEEGLQLHQHATLRLEALLTLFRVYARQSMTQRAMDALYRFRDLVTEMTSNVVAQSGRGITAFSGVSEIAGEAEVLGRKTK